MPKRDKNFVWPRVDARSLDLKGMKVAIVGGAGGIGRALSRVHQSGPEPDARGSPHSVASCCYAVHFEGDTHVG